jgi:hypothetical protein
VIKESTVNRTSESQTEFAARQLLKRRCTDLNLEQHSTTNSPINFHHEETIDHQKVATRRDRAIEMLKCCCCDAKGKKTLEYQLEEM